MPFTLTWQNRHTIVQPPTQSMETCMADLNLFETFPLGKLTLSNRLVMNPMTRCRADAAGVPNALMAQYYVQRASAGLIISEGIAPSANGKGYARMPGLWNGVQVQAWKAVTSAVHAAKGVIFAQLMHSGRVSHPANMTAGAKIVAPSAIALSYTHLRAHETDSYLVCRLL